MGLFMLAGSVVREPGQSLDDQDCGGRRRRGRKQSTRIVERKWGRGRGAGDGGAGVRGDAAHERRVERAADDEGQGDGAWDVACERKRGSHLLFDRQSVRELGGTTLFRWAPAEGEAPVAGAAVYTAVADCRAKSIEARWPGKRTQTRVGTCGRHMVEAVCAVSASAKAER